MSRYDHADDALYLSKQMRVVTEPEDDRLLRINRRLNGQYQSSEGGDTSNNFVNPSITSTK